MLSLLLASLAAAAPCDGPVSPTDVVAQVDDAMITWATLDEEGFSDLAVQILADVECLNAPLTPAQAASIHRVRALQAFLAGEVETAVLAFRAAATAEPGYVLSEKVAPQGGKLWRLYQQAVGAGRPSAAPLAPPEGYTPYVDGAAGAKRSTEVPAIVQLEGKGAVSWSRYLQAGAPFSPTGLPTLAPLADLDAPDPDQRPPKAPKEPKSSGSGAALWGAAGASAAISAGLFGASAGLRSSFDNQPTRGKMSAVNGTFIGSVSMLVVSGGLVAAAAAQ